MTETSQVRLDSMSQDFRDAKNHVYGLAHNVCVDGLEQRALLNALSESETEMIRADEDGKAIILTLLGIIIDGVQYGNWPWVKNAVNTLKQG
jgi:hypothetical protein